MVKVIIAFFIPCLILYLAGSYAAWDFNPGNWSTDGRVVIAFLTCVFSSATAGFIAAHSR